MAFTIKFSSLVRLRNGTRLFSFSSMKYGSIIPFKLSDIGEGIREVTIKEWFVKAGDTVSQFDNICEVQSDKASVTITSRFDGKIKALYYQIDDVALVGNPLLDIEVENDIDNSTVNTDNKDTKIQNANSSITESLDENIEITDGSREKVLTTPAVRKIAIEHNINLKNVRPTGKLGRVLKEDVLAFLDTQKKTLDIKKNSSQFFSSEKQQNEIEEIIPLKGYEKHMWKTMTQSLNIPHFVYSDECDVSKLLKLRSEMKDVLNAQGIALSFMPFFIKAASKSLTEYPRLNSWLDDTTQSLRIFKRHNISVAMDTSDGLVVPNIKNVQSLSISQIAKELNRLQQHGRVASLPLNDLSGGTFTLSNIGMIGGTYTKPVILSPQIVIGALGKIQKLPRFDSDEKNIFAANIINISWAADHRVVDGVTMAKFSNSWRYYIENPTLLLI